MKNTVICYKVKTPVYYNKGTKWEKTCDVFLAYVTFKKLDAAKEEVEKLNSEKPAKLWNGTAIDWNNVEYFFANEQESF